MRLSCPGCSAEYEVDLSLIPSGGREVQCSACGTTWSASADGKGGPAAAIRDAGRRARAADDDHGPPTDDADAHVVPAATRATIDPGIRALLEDEAARELAVRRGAGREATGTSPSPVDDDDNNRRKTESDASREPADRPAPAAQAGADRPDPGTIGRTLRRRMRRRDRREAGSGRGFALGFTLPVVAASILILTYLWAAPIANTVPALEPAMIAYVDGVNLLRDRLDAALSASAGRIAELLLRVAPGEA